MRWTLASQAQIREVGEHGSVGREPSCLFERDQRLAQSAQANLQDLAELAQRPARQAVVSARFGDLSAPLQSGSESVDIRPLSLDRAQLAHCAQVVRLESKQLLERFCRQIEIERELLRRNRQPAVVADPLRRLASELGECFQATAELAAVPASLREREHSLESDAMARVQLEGGREQLFRLLRLPKPAPVQLPRFGPERGPLGSILGRPSGSLQGLRQLSRAASGSKVGQQLV